MSVEAATVKKPVILCILDGWGYREQTTDNAIKLANTPVYDRLWQDVPQAWLKTSGLAVGLPDGQMGNSEVGHTNIGCGRVTLQDLPKIDEAATSGELAKNAELLAFIDTLQASGGTAHIAGLLSPGGVHSHQRHIAALVNIIASAGVPVRVHAYLDGRDTPPRSAMPFLEEFEAAIADANDAEIATITGRYWAMDRDKRWSRVEKAYNAAAYGKAAYTAASATEATSDAYTRDENDEFIEPTIIGDYTGMNDGDGLMMANFRADRAREILTAFVDPTFDGFNRPSLIKFAAQAGMVNYSEAHDKFFTVLFPADETINSFGEVIAGLGLKQLRISETEKYSHVTFFFNGGTEQPFEGEDRILIPSPDVATYDLKPEMSAPEVTEQLVEAIESGKYAAIIVNYANPDMVGHTGVLSAAIKAVETIDDCIGKLEIAAKNSGAALLVTADHGNVEMMKDEATGQPHTAHTNFDVPALLINHDAAFADGCLADIAPSLLHIMGLSQPAEMTGMNLVDETEKVRSSA